MRRLFTTFVAVIALTLTFALPASAGAKTGAVEWVCLVPGEGLVTFVSAPAPAFHGISQANLKAGAAFNRQFGEVCHVEVNT